MTNETSQGALKADSLLAALTRHGIELPPEQVAQLDRYCHLLWDWNTRLNLTRHTDYEKFATRDVVDSLALSQFIEPGEDILDVGTGGGVPGIILAITRPDISVSLCESVGKKARAVREIARGIPLQLPIHHARAEELLAQGHTYDTLVLRAVAHLEKLLRWLRPHFGAFHRMLLVKGPSWVDERKHCRERRLLKNLALRRLHTYQTPGTQAESVVLQIAMLGEGEE
jgi:16S rRNA (guanine527-N7)-methyltransferase